MPITSESSEMNLGEEFRVGDWTVRPHTNALVGPEGETHIEPKAMQVLTLLADQAGRVVPKREILTEVWNGTYVSDEVLPNAIWELRKALGDDARRPSFIQTLPKKGYRLIAPVTREPEEDAAALDGVGPAWWRSPRRATLAVLLAAAVVSGTVLALRSRGVGTSPAGDGPYSVLVMSFENHTRSEELDWLSSGVATMLRTGLAESTGLQVVSGERVDQLLEENASETGRALARRTHAQAVVLGSVFELGEELRIDVQVEDVADERIVAAHSVRGEDVFELLDELTERVRESLAGEGASSVAAAPPVNIKEMTTASLEAFRLYNDGVTARRHLRLADARRLLTEAVQIDPSFALAHLELRWIAYASKDEARSRYYEEKILEHRDRLPARERMLLEAQERWKSDPAEAERLIQTILRQNRDDEEAYMQLAHLHRSSHDEEKSLAVLERGVEALPHSGYLRLYYGYGLLALGRFPEAIQQFETYARINPEEANPRDSLGEAYLIAGVPRRALEEYGRALEVDADFSTSHIGRAWAHAQLGEFAASLAELDQIDSELPPGSSAVEIALLRGYVLTRWARFQEAQTLTQGLSRRAEKDEGPITRALVVLFGSLVAIERGRWSDGRAQAREAIELLRSAQPPMRRLTGLAELLAGIGASRAGDVDAAERHLALLRKVHEPRHPVERWWVHLLAGEIRLARGDARGALEEFNRGEPRYKMMFNVTHLLDNIGGGLSFRDGPARARALAGDYAGAIETYRKLLRPDIGQKWTAVLEPRYHAEIARLYDRVGESEPARRHYRALLDLWSGADEALPEVAEARAYLAESSR